MSSSARIAVAVAMVTLLVGCTSAPGEPAPTDTATTTAPAETPELPKIGSYVAIGDSFTAGPGLAALRDDAGFCLRSTHNWPSLLDRTLDAAAFTDVSCVGASTASILERGTGITSSRPQIDAVKPDTDLVTVGIGGNDGNLFASLISACTDSRGACGTFARDRAPAILDETTTRIATTLDAIRAKAPEATILLVGYPRILPNSGACDSIGIPDAASVLETEQRLEDTLAAAAQDAGVDYVSMREASRGHDACAGAEAWTNGSAVPDGDGIAFHPRLAGMQAIARAVAGELAKD